MEHIPGNSATDHKNITGSKISRELESLRQKIANLEHLEPKIKIGGGPASSSHVDHPLKKKIESRLGFFPPLFAPALETPQLLESLWQQELQAYQENPIPRLFKEKLSARLSRFCASSYFIITHACVLRSLGMTGEEVKRLLEKPAPRVREDHSQLLEAIITAPHPLDSWPAQNSPLEESLICCCMIIFLEAANAERCTAELRELLGPSYYAYLVTLLAYIRASHLWVEAHPEISFEEHPQVRENFLPLMRSEPHLLEIFQNHYQWPGQYYSILEDEKEILASEERYRQLFENARDIIYAHDLDGNLISINKAIERISGYTRAEALQMKITDIVAPDYLEVARKMIDCQVSGEMPANYELEILSKDGGRAVLGINTRPIFREGQPVAIQGIAHDISERKKTENALQQANKKLEAWVNELEQQTREMMLLNEMGDILRACLTTEEAYSVIVRVAQQLFPVQVGVLYVISPSRNLVEAVAVWGDSSLAEQAFSPQECWALRRGRTHCVEDSRTGLACRHIHHTPADGYLCVPMMAQSEALGILHLCQPENVKMTEAKLRLVATMSEHIAMALSNLRLHETLRSQSIRDPLTGLFNRRFMEESLELEIRRAARNQRPLGVIMVDLDHFKRFNDTFGHEAGDTLLKELASLLQTHIRGEDIACRYGGEEFTLILPEGSGEITRQRAQFLKEAIKHLDVDHRGQPLGRITVSMGVAVFPDHGQTGKALLEAADKALYVSKEEGRDRVTVAD